MFLFLSVHMYLFLLSYVDFEYIFITFINNGSSIWYMLCDKGGLCDKVRLSLVQTECMLTPNSCAEDLNPVSMYLDMLSAEVIKDKLDHKSRTIIQ